MAIDNGELRREAGARHRRQRRHWRGDLPAPGGRRATTSSCTRTARWTKPTATAQAIRDSGGSAEAVAFDVTDRAA